MVATTVHLLRHGEVHNPEGLLYGRLPGYRLSERGLEMAELVARTLAGEQDAPRRDVVVVTASPLQRAQETAAPIAAAFGLAVGTDDRLIEAENHFQGQRFGVGDGSLRHPEHWPHLRNPFRPSWGEPYAEQVDRMLAAVDAARVAARGHEAVLVSHQLPIWVTRLALENRRLWHDPRRRQCSLASLTSLRFEDDTLVGVGYGEPAAALLPGASAVSGA
ncbi:histidine phosphatase family protein [Cellulomonas sp. Sa3CUA2]|uniref:Histidine phosphatase family protein n=1 Tax=Cellulomonas avistercoris TaxID=2762242 RepID=A0ABR8QI92_9CELL|nr:histidine phosphatase family protein [Cellulomonas avistercoris]MBD7920056.1 histidine phosphatase family protein [Cellulomonas avistercoris]